MAAEAIVALSAVMDSPTIADVLPAAVAGILCLSRLKSDAFTRGVFFTLNGLQGMAIGATRRLGSRLGSGLGLLWRLLWRFLWQPRKLCRGRTCRSCLNLVAATLAGCTDRVVALPASTRHWL